jgi:hypothetical protein
MKKSFRIEVILGLTAGILLERNGFGEIRLFAGFVAGHDVWTHEMADEDFVRRITEAVFAQYPSLREAETFVHPRGPAFDEYLRGYGERARRRFGESLEIEAGVGERAESPVNSFDRLAPIAK